MNKHISFMLVAQNAKWQGPSLDDHSLGFLERRLGFLRLKRSLPDVRGDPEPLVQLRG
jgi:hypothetical protein